MLPTIEQCKEFKRLIDAGRAAAELPPIEFLEFDNAEPGSTGNCLSATNLFAETGFEVGHEEIDGYEHDINVAAVRAIGSGPGEQLGQVMRFRIPEGITVVTNPFDHKEPGLRERLVEAGVVAP